MNQRWVVDCLFVFSWQQT